MSRNCSISYVLYRYRTENHWCKTINVLKANLVYEIVRFLIIEQNLNRIYLEDRNKGLESSL